MTKFYEAINAANHEMAENRRRFIHNFSTKSVEDLQEGDNKAQLELVSLMWETLINKEFEKVEKVETLKQNKDLEIHYARYGMDTHKSDVIDPLREQISPHQRLNLLINNDNLGGDFYPGKEKQLHIIYTFNGILYEEKLNEGEVLSIPKLAVEVRKTDDLPSSIILAVLSLVLGISLVIKRL